MRLGSASRVVFGWFWGQGYRQATARQPHFGQLCGGVVSEVRALGKGKKWSGFAAEYLPIQAHSSTRPAP